MRGGLPRDGGLNLLEPAIGSVVALQASRVPDPGDSGEESGSVFLKTVWTIPEDEDADRLCGCR
jgi:hypothetical protein